ncbi:MAG: aldo/keto reductase [Candidatus Doudnabacteria bacterium]|nr:aldo/keto reductase [Candidatus Doudnabacteria bacterium]
MEYVTLNTGVKIPRIGLGNSNRGNKIPQVGLGTWKAQPNQVGEAVRFALEEAGYRHLDCAPIYFNEKEIGEVLGQIFREGKIKREEVFITSKLWNNAHAAKDVEPALGKTLDDLQIDYLDLYLVHWGVAIKGNIGEEHLDATGTLISAPVSIQETWEAMEALVAKGLVKAVGVSNFTAPMLLDLLSYAEIAPVVNQIELHPYNAQTRLVEFCHNKNIAVIAYSPLGRPRSVINSGSRLPVLIQDPVVMNIAKAHGKSEAQILLRWAVQRNTIVIPKSMNPENMKSNLLIFDFELTGQEMQALTNLDRKLRYVNPYDWWKIPYFD